MNSKEYGDKYQDHFIEEYKVLAQSLDAIGERRVDFNKFYLSILSGLLAIVSLIIEKSLFSDIYHFVFLLIAILGLCLCVLWQMSTRSFERISKTRYEVLAEMEKELPFPTFNLAGQYLHQDKKYVVIGKITRYTSFLLILPYFLLLVYSVYHIFF